MDDQLTNQEYLHRHFVELGRKGGSVKSERKTKSSRRNGKKNKGRKKEIL